MSAGRNTERVDELGRLHTLGFDAAIGSIPHAHNLEAVERIGTDVIRAAAAF